MIKYNQLRIPGRVTTPFGARTKDEQSHQGMDIANVTGTPIPALRPGVVTGVGQATNGLGNVVKLRDNEGNVHQYSHLQKALVRPGMRVQEGQEIAKMGSSGNSYSPSGNDPSHLDIRIVNAFWRYKNPLLYLKNR